MSYYGSYRTRYATRTSSRSTTARASTPATDKQLDFLRNLVDGRALDEGERETMARLLAQEVVSMASASNAIEYCKAKPYKPTETANPVTEVGMYLRDGVFYKVQIAKASRKLYAKRLCIDGAAEFDDDGHLLRGAPCHFEYEGGAVYRLQADNRLTIEQAKEFGVNFGTCCVCGALLTDPKSIAQGIGPVCIKRI